jgi:hypothetical protein
MHIFNILLERTIINGHVEFGCLVDIFDEFVPTGEILGRVFESKITTHLMHDKIVFVIFSVFSKIFNQLFRFFLKVFFIDLFISIHSIDLETSRWAIMVSHEKSENILGSRNYLNMLISFFSLSFIFFLMIHSSEDPGVIAHFRVDLSLSQRMSKRVNLPSNFWDEFLAQMFFYVLLTIRMIINNIFVIYACLVIHRNSGTQKLKLASVENISEFFFFIFILRLPPPFEKSNFYLMISSTVVFCQFLYDGI